MLVDDNRLNLGLSLEFEAKKLTMLGCSHHGDDGGKFSLKAIDLLNENITPLSSPQFFNSYPENPQGDVYSDMSFFRPIGDQGQSQGNSGLVKEYLEKKRREGSGRGGR